MTRTKRLGLEVESDCHRSNPSCRGDILLEIDFVPFFLADIHLDTALSSSHSLRLKFMAWLVFDSYPVFRIWFLSKNMDLFMYLKGQNASNIVLPFSVQD